MVEWNHLESEEGKVKITKGCASQIENFQLFDEANAGEDIIIAEHDGQAVAYAQYTDMGNDVEIHFMESEVKGTGRAMMDWFKDRYEHIVAINVEPTAEGFYAKMGFERYGGDGFGGFNMDWWAF
jgi:hypothetical protein